MSESSVRLVQHPDKGEGLNQDMGGSIRMGISHDSDMVNYRGYHY